MKRISKLPKGAKFTGCIADELSAVETYETSKSTFKVFKNEFKETEIYEYPKKQ